jgi:hypothetical protein
MAQLYGDYRKKLQQFATLSKSLSVPSSAVISGVLHVDGRPDAAAPSLSPGQEGNAQLHPVSAELSIFCVVKSL